MQNRKLTLKDKERAQDDLDNKCVIVRNSLEELADSVESYCGPQTQEEFKQVNMLVEMFLEDIELIE